MGEAMCADCWRSSSARDLSGRGSTARSLNSIEAPKIQGGPALGRDRGRPARGARGRARPAHGGAGDRAEVESARGARARGRRVSRRSCGVSRRAMRIRRPASVIEDFTPKHFSFNTHLGACPACEGVGAVMACDPGLLVPDADEVHPGWRDQGLVEQAAETQGAARPEHREPGASILDADVDGALRLPERRFQARRFSTAPAMSRCRPAGKLTRNKRSLAKPFEGLVPMVERLFARAKGASLKAQLARYLNPLPCKACGGRRLKPEVLAVRLKSEIRNLESRDRHP